jgi:hypothetical protein
LKAKTKTEKQSFRLSQHWRYNKWQSQADFLTV